MGCQIEAQIKSFYSDGDDLCVYTFRIVDWWFSIADAPISINNPKSSINNFKTRPIDLRSKNRYDGLKKKFNWN
jgi:hypothetical protein